MFARTPRLLLRPIWAEDAELLRRLAQPVPKACVPQAGLPDLLILRRTEGRPEPVGRISLVRHGASQLALRVWIAPDCRRRGFALEAGRAVIDMARHCLGSRLLLARATSSDESLQRLYARLGFTLSDQAGGLFSLLLEKSRESLNFGLAA